MSTKNPSMHIVCLDWWWISISLDINENLNNKMCKPSEKIRFESKTAVAANTLMHKFDGIRRRFFFVCFIENERKEYIVTEHCFRISHSGVDFAISPIKTSEFSLLPLYGLQHCSIHNSRQICIRNFFKGKISNNRYFPIPGDFVNIAYDRNA